MQRYIRLLLFLIGAILLRMVGSWWFTKGIEHPDYTVTKKTSSYEIRNYKPYILAQATIEKTTMRQEMSSGFREVAGYIFGGNDTQQSIAMTAPVLSERTETTNTISFVMPRERDRKTLPIPNSTNVTISEQPARTLAVYSFSGRAEEERSEEKLQVFKNLLYQDKISSTGSFILAQYDPPSTPPRMRTNEWMVEIVVK